MKGDHKKNWLFLFDSNFDLQKLPNLFFPISTILDSKYHHKNKIKFNNDSKITFENYADNIFNSFIEIDLVRINMNNFDIQPEFFSSLLLMSLLFMYIKIIIINIYVK